MAKEDKNKEVTQSPSPNLALWLSVETTDKETLSPVILEGGFKGLSPDAYAQLKNATEKFGPYGLGFGFSKLDIQYHFSDKIEFAYAQLKGEFFYVLNGERVTFPVSNARWLTHGKDRKRTNDIDKSLVTDTITKCLSYLGFNADVFMGQFDGQWRDEWVAGQNVVVWNSDSPKTVPQPSSSLKSKAPSVKKSLSLSDDAKKAILQRFRSGKSPQDVYDVMVQNGYSPGVELHELLRDMYKAFLAKDPIVSPMMQRFKEGKTPNEVIEEMVNAGHGADEKLKQMVNGFYALFTEKKGGKL